MEYLTHPVPPSSLLEVAIPLHYRFFVCEKCGLRYGVPEQWLQGLPPWPPKKGQPHCPAGHARRQPTRPKKRLVALVLPLLREAGRTRRRDIVIGEIADLIGAPSDAVEELIGNAKRVTLADAAEYVDHFWAEESV